MNTKKRPNYKCMHCGYEWHSHTQNMRQNAFCPKCYKKTVVSVNSNIVVFEISKLKIIIKKRTKNIKKQLNKQFQKMSIIKEQYNFQLKIITDVFILIITMMFVIYFVYTYLIF